MEAERALSSRGWQEEVAADRRGGGGAGAGRFHGWGKGGWIGWEGTRAGSLVGDSGGLACSGQAGGGRKRRVVEESDGGGTGLAGCYRVRGAGGGGVSGGRADFG